MYLTYILSFALALYIHELGHLLAARACMVPVSEFGMGWGRELFRFDHGGVSYRMHLLPVGAYVRMDMNALQTRPLSQQVLVLLAGIFVNLAAAAISTGTSFSVINLLLAATNLLPLYQQDGWKCGMVFLRSVMKRKNPLVEWTFTITGGLLSVLLIILGISQRLA
jgi:membrane-associated protease RseP (regulator of RpoE activity)